MKLLLDTHAFLWAAMRPSELSATVRGLLQDRNNDVYLSAVSLWEISLKFALGKLDLQGVTPDDLPTAAETMGFELVALGSAEAATFHHLPRHEHRDPFDRMLAWQAIRNGWTLVSRDSQLAVYEQNGLAIAW